MAVQVIDTMIPKVKGKFPIAYAEDIQFSDGNSLEKYREKLSFFEAAEITRPSPVFQAGKKKIKENEESFLTISLTRKGNMVHASIEANVELITNSTKTREKIPEGYRPPCMEFIPLYEADGYSEPSIMKIEPDGDIFIYPPSVELEDSGLSTRYGSKVWMTFDDHTDKEV